MVKTIFLAKYGNISPDTVYGWSPEKVALAAKITALFMEAEKKAQDDAAAQAQAKAQSNSGTNYIKANQRRRY